MRKRGIVRLVVAISFSILVILVLLLIRFNSHVYISPFNFLKFENATIRLDFSVSIIATPDKLRSNGEWATVSWNGVSNPNKDDWIGVYPLRSDKAVVNPKEQAPLKYQYCWYSQSHLSDGKGSFRFYLVNMRTPYVFAFLRNGFENSTLVATSNPVSFDNPNEPLQGHLMLTGDPTQMKLMWVTRDSDNPEVRYGLADGTAITVAKASSETYKASDMCGPPATGVGFLDPGQLHTAVMENLSPGQRISYQFGDDKYGWSKLYNFTVPPQIGPKSNTRIIAYGDMGQGQLDNAQQPRVVQFPSLNTTQLVEEEASNANSILHIGDISYARGYAGVWDEFFDQIQPISTQLPYMVCIGNHERDFPNSGSYYTNAGSGGECGVPYDIRFPMPRPSRDQDWYTFKLGNIQVVLMSTEHNFTTGSVQYNWIKDTLSKVDRKQTPWLIFAGHRPMYCDTVNVTYRGGILSSAREMRKHIEPLFKEYKVDLALWGHHHSYQRTCHVYQEKCTGDSTDTVNVVIGMAGQSLAPNILPRKPDWIEFIDVEHYGYSRITTNETTLLFEYVRNNDGAVHDKLTLRKTYS